MFIWNNWELVNLSPCVGLNYNVVTMAQVQSSPKGSLPGDMDDAGGINRGEIFEMLSNTRRRYVLHYLKQCEDGKRVPLREIVDQVAAWEQGTEISQLDSAERKRVYTALKQTHLGRLDESGIVDYDQLRGEVELTDTAEEVQFYLEYVPADDITWSQYYLGLSSVCAFLVGAIWTGVPLLGDVDWLGFSVLVVALYLLSSTVHWYYIRNNRLGSHGPPHR